MRQLIDANQHVWAAKFFSTWSTLDSTMDGMPSRRVSFSLQVEETTVDDRILLYNRHHGTRDSMNSGMDRLETIFGIELGLESGSSKTGDVQLGSPRNDGVDKANIQLFHRTVCKMGARCFAEICFAAVEDSLGNSMVVITQRTLYLHPPFAYTSRIRVSICGYQYKVHVIMKK